MGLWPACSRIIYDYTHTESFTIQQPSSKLCGALPPEWGNPISAIPNEETKARASRERKERKLPSQ